MQRFIGLWGTCSTLVLLLVVRGKAHKTLHGVSAQMMTFKRFPIIVIVLLLGAFAGWLYVEFNRGGKGFGVVDVNTADINELDALPYITPAAAQAIVDGRPFIRVDDLIRVSGIGEKTLERIRPYVTVQ